MPFRPEPHQPDFASLIVSLDNSKIQRDNYALYQTIFLLIQAVTRARDLLLKKIEDLEDAIIILNGAAFKTVEVDLGSTPTWRGKFTIVDVSIVSTSRVIIKQAVGPYTGKGTRADEAEMDQLWCVAEPQFHQATVYWRTQQAQTASFSEIRGMQPNHDAFLGSLTQTVIGKVKGNFKFNYAVVQS